MVTAEPWPDDSLFVTVDQAATLFLTTGAVIRNVLWERKTEFETPRYAKRGGQWRRLLTANDLAVLRQVFQTRVRPG